MAQGLWSLEGALLLAMSVSDRGLRSEDALGGFRCSCESVCNKPPLHTKSSAAAGGSGRMASLKQEEGVQTTGNLSKDCGILGERIVLPAGAERMQW